jgi:hypothetical protein
VTLSAFAIGDTAGLTYLGFVTSDGGTTDTLTFASGTDFGGTGWRLTPDGQSGTDVTLVMSSG